MVVSHLSLGPNSFLDSHVIISVIWGERKAFVYHHWHVEASWLLPGWLCLQQLSNLRLLGSPAFACFGRDKRKAEMQMS